MQPHQVLILFSSSELGGAERSLTRMTLAADKGAFALATLDGPGPWSDWCQELGITPFVLGKESPNGRHGQFGLTSLLHLIRLVRQKRFAAIYVIGFRASLWIRLAKPFLRDARLIQGIRWNPASASRLDKAFRCIERLLHSLIDLYICNSQTAAKTLKDKLCIPESKIKVIYNGLDNLPPVPCPIAQRLLQVITVANLNPRKGYFEYLEVIEHVVKELPDAHFVFVGRDDMNGQLASEIQHRGLHQSITLTGYQADVGQWLDEAQLMVLPSLWGEGCPTSILEGFAHGLPVVAYAIDGVPELVNEKQDGFLIRPGDKALLAAAIVRLLKDSALAQTMGMAGYTKVAHQFTLMQCANLHSSVFAQLLANSGKRKPILHS